MSSVLECEYIEQTRPYSQEELGVLRKKLYGSLRLSKMIAHHKKCDHFYYVKKNGKKEKEMIDNGIHSVGNCSVCWKIYNSPSHLRVKARNMVDTYCGTFYNDPKALSYDNLDLETVFYKWLYVDKVDKVEKVGEVGEVDK